MAMSQHLQGPTDETARATRPSRTEGRSSELSEIYRQLYVSLDLPHNAHPLVIGVTSAISGEGRTTVALGLAQTLAADLDTPITLVEVDLERPSLALHFGVAPSPGLCEVLRGECGFDEVMRAVSEDLSVVTAGTVGPDSARLLHQLPARDPFHGTEAPQGLVILDLPPVINHSYSSLAASVADAVVLVVRAGVTPSDVVQEAIARLENRPPQGVVFNAPRTAFPT
jgi:non-specific protein-tyrosine kinase